MVKEAGGVFTCIIVIGGLVSELPVNSGLTNAHVFTKNKGKKVSCIGVSINIIVNQVACLAR